MQITNRLTQELWEVVLQTCPMNDCVCLCVMLPAVRPAPAGAAAAGSPAASVPPPAAYGYTPNQSAPGSSGRRSQSESAEAGEKQIGAQATSDISRVGKQEERKRKRRKVDLLKRCESRHLEIKRERQQQGV